MSLKIKKIDGYEGDKAFRANLIETDCPGWDIDVWGLQITNSEAEEKAQRVISCWNACEGVETEVLEPAFCKRILDALQEIRSEIPDKPKLALTSKIKEIVDAVLEPKDATI